MLEALGSDRLFQQLCKSQRCYRARLERKPWRVGNTVCHKLDRIEDNPHLNPIAEKIKTIHDRATVGTGMLAKHRLLGQSQNQVCPNFQCGAIAPTVGSQRAIAKMRRMLTSF